jgi:hypothetical protein
MSLAAEYRDLNPDTPPIRFFSLYRSSKGTQIESADTLPEIQHNSILDQYSEFYQAEEDMFYQSMKVNVNQIQRFNLINLLMERFVE